MRWCLVLMLLGCQRHASKLDDHFSPTTIVDPPQADGLLAGTVVETIPAATYTYVRLQRDGKDVWLAGPETPIAVGAKLGPLQGTLMPNFHSDSLNRTFPEIYFVTTFGQPVPASHGAPALAGTVVTTMDAGGYTYAQITSASGTKTWLAGPTTKLAVGAKIAGATGSLMTEFHSSTLNRTFDQIYFVNSWGGGVASSAHVPQAAPAGERVTAAPNGKTVAQITSALDGKIVDVRGKVVKLTSNVLDRNWFHLRDGSGDLMVTSKEDVKVGEIVTVRGTVGANRDLGAGYHYDVLVENATVTR